jgi:catalase
MLKTKLLFAATALAAFGFTTPLLAEDAPLEVQIIDAMNKLFGVHPGFRANHAKGIVAEGSFKASPDAATLSKAALFSGSAIPVTIRFSDATGVPGIPDGAGGANPHGLAMKFHVPGAGDTDMVLNSLHFFPVGTGEEFRDLLLAIAASPPDSPKPTKAEQFIAAHPNVPKASATATTPASFADEEYFGVNAFVFVDKAGRKQAVRYIAQPEKVVHLAPADAAKQTPNFLVDDLPKRVAAKPVVFHIKAQLAGPADQTKDGSQPWPDTNKVVELGVLTIDKVVPNSAEAEKVLLFLPNALIEGIEPSDDAFIDLRSGAYAVSFSRRAQ